MNESTLTALAKNPPLKFYNIGVAVRHIAELENKLGLPASEPSYNIRRLNARILELESKIPKRTAPAALAPAAAVTTPATTEKLVAGMLPPSELMKLKKQNASCVIAGISLGARLDLLKGQIRAHLGTDQEATISRFAHLSGDAEHFLCKVLEDAERRNAVDHRQACERAACVRLEHRRKLAATGTRMPYTVAEATALAETIFSGTDAGDVLTSNLRLASDDAAKMTLICGVFHSARLSAPGLDLSGVKVSSDNDTAQQWLTPERRALAEQMISDFDNTLNGTAPLAAFDRAGARAARQFIRSATGRDSV